MTTLPVLRTPTAPRSGRMVFCLLALTLASLVLPSTASSQRGQQQPPPKPTGEHVRVPTSYANVHMGSGTGSEILVLVPKGTVLAVVGRDKEWVRVQLTPELRKTGMVMRWYKNEETGWMHDSTVEVVKADAK